MTRRERIEREWFADGQTYGYVDAGEFSDIRAELRALWAVVDAAVIWDRNPDMLAQDAVERVLTDALDAYHAQQEGDDE